MPTKKTRVCFIPRDDVLDIVNKLSYENNLSYSKIINILVEEALYKRGLFNKIDELGLDEINANLKDNNLSWEKKNNDNDYFNYNFKNKLLKEKNINAKEKNDEYLDTEIYTKFLMFLQFQERMKKNTFHN
tara:strand:+ start:72 stop:464 length:393 start_codon:yes stop_codon:yes gene_type:complete